MKTKDPQPWHLGAPRRIVSTPTSKCDLCGAERILPEGKQPIFSSCNACLTALEAGREVLQERLAFMKSDMIRGNEDSPQRPRTESQKLKTDILAEWPTSSDTPEGL